VEPDPQDPGGAYFSGFSQVYHRTEGTPVFMKGSITDTRINALGIVSETPRVLYAGGSSDSAFMRSTDVGKVFRSNDGGETWTQLDVGQPISQVIDVAVDLSNSATVYIATFCGFCSDPSMEDPGLGIFRSDDAGETWYPVTRTIGHVSVSSLVMDPTNPQTLYASAVVTNSNRERILRSDDGGKSWITTSFEVPARSVNDIAVDPLAPSTVYVGTSQGLHRSENRGESWTRAAGQFGDVEIRALATASFKNRTLIYVAALGGQFSNDGMGLFNTSAENQGDVVGAGVYQHTISHVPLNERVYLPLVTRE
jgi:photosystem II stability/assembly factor-like uncharacterized protein